MKCVMWSRGLSRDPPPLSWLAALAAGWLDSVQAVPFPIPVPMD